MIFSGRARTQSAGNVLTHLTSRDGVPHVQPEKQSAFRSPGMRGPDSERAVGSFFVRSETKTRGQKSFSLD